MTGPRGWRSRRIFHFAGTRSYFTVARASRDIFKQSSIGALYTDWECPTTGEYNRSRWG